MSQHHPEEPAKPIFRGELALLIIAVLNSFAVDLMLYSGFGISSISSVPYVFSAVLPSLSLGTWTYLFQTALVGALMVLRRRFVPSYLLAFAVGIAFGKMMDIHMLWIAKLPLNPPLALLYLVISFAALSFGIGLSNHCRLPIIPTDLFPRELSGILGRPYKAVKTCFDLGCLAVTVLLSLLFLHGIQGIGLGTVLCALTMGKSISAAGKLLSDHFTFVSFLDRRPPGGPSAPVNPFISGAGAAP